MIKNISKTILLAQFFGFISLIDIIIVNTVKAEIVFEISHHHNFMICCFEFLCRSLSEVIVHFAKSF